MSIPMLYIHGFASSGCSFKAGVLRGAFPGVYAPSLSHIPCLAVQTLEEFIRSLHRPVIIGSSLGGYYARYLAEKHDLRAVLINPVIEETMPASGVLGLQKSCFDGSAFEFTAEHMQSLRRYRARGLEPWRFLVLAQMGDRLLDHRKTLTALAGARIVSQEGGSHGFDDFPSVIPLIRDFAQRPRD